jgi:DNA invertase Pin-like site-specific DNA recombinase
MVAAGFHSAGLALKPQAYSYLRMSTDPQLLGDSRRRQLEASRAYAVTNGLELAEGAELEDIGVSAFKGANVRDGALGQFLEAVRSGSVRPGSYLIVESLDRLSREQVLTAQSLFLSIIQAGINLVTLMDGKVYRAGTTDLADLIMSLVIMSRAHEESLTKSRRIAAAWKNKRSEAVEKPMTKWCPAWLKLSSDRSCYEPIPERIEIVRQIFTDTAEGIGMYSIATRLNKAKVATFGGPNGWHQSYVAKILSSRAVLGEFQPHIRVDGRRVPHGEPVPDYFPTILQEELFYRAQLGKTQRRGTGAGRKGAGFTNLFSGIAKCDYCDASILFENKGLGPKGGTYLVCDGAKRQKNCPSIRWRYADFEASFLAFVEELDVKSIVNASAHLETHDKLQRELAALHGELSSVTDLMEQTYAVLSQGGPVDFVTGKLNELEKRRVKLSDDIKLKSEEQQEMLSREKSYLRSKEEIRQLVGQIQSSESDELFKLRAQVASQLKVLVRNLSLGSLGMRPRLLASIKRLRTSGKQQAEAAIAHMDQAAASPKHSRRYFSVGFRDGNVRVVFPDADDPLRYQQQIIASDDKGFEVLRPESS